MNLFLASLIVTIGVYCLSYIWFGPLVFRKLYEKQLERSNKAKPHPRMLIFGLFFALTYIAVATLAYFVALAPGKTFWDGARMGLYLWIFYLALEFSNTLFNRVNIIVQTINWAFWLIVSILSGGLLGLLMRM